MLASWHLTGNERRHSWELGSNATLRLPRDPTQVVRVERGLVLVTREGDGEDHVLEPGMELSLRAPGLVVAWALEPSTIRVEEPDTSGMGRCA
jgi:hypothetical protein